MCVKLFRREDTGAKNSFTSAVPDSPIEESVSCCLLFVLYLPKVCTRNDPFYELPFSSLNPLILHIILDEKFQLTETSVTAAARVYPFKNLPCLLSAEGNKQNKPEIGFVNFLTSFN